MYTSLLIKQNVAQSIRLGGSSSIQLATFLHWPTGGIIGYVTESNYGRRLSFRFDVKHVPNIAVKLTRPYLVSKTLPKINIILMDQAKGPIGN